MELSSSYIYSPYQKFLCPRCEFLLNSTVHIPIVAPCGHTFCCMCIEEDFKALNKFRCDLCKKETTEHFSMFPKNLYILSIRKNKIKNENIFIGGKSPRAFNKNTKLVRSITSSNSSLLLSYGGSQAKKISSFFSIVNEITYQFIDNKFEIIEREVNLDSIFDEKKECPSDYSCKKLSCRFHGFVNHYLYDDSINLNKKSLNARDEDFDVIVAKKIDIIDFYGDEIRKKNRPYPALYNYTELLKKIFKYQDKYTKKYFNPIVTFIVRTLVFFGLLILNVYLIKYIDLAFFFLFINILLEKEKTIYEISIKIKMLLALSCFYFVEDIVKNLGFNYLMDMSSYISNISSGTRTLFNLLVLGNDSTLNLVVFIILNICSNLHLLLN